METRNKSPAASSGDDTTTAKLNDNVNDDGVVPEKPNDAQERGLLMQAESDPSEENRVPGKIRAPRYFNPPESGTWLEGKMCNENYNERKKRKRGKACYICGDHRHKRRRCRQAKSCVLCDKIGHLAVECPNKDAGEDSKSQLCLKCGNSDHTTFTCTNNYDPEDLKAIQCYICKDFGHLGCNNHKTEAPPKVTCYNCGKSGHLGQDCPKSPGQSIKAILTARNEATSKKEKKKKKRRGGKKKKTEQPPTIINALNNPCTWPRPPILSSTPSGLSYARPGANIWLSPQAAASRNLFPDPNPGTAPQHQPINYSAGTRQILNPPVSMHQFPRFSLDKGCRVMDHVHGHKAQIPVNSNTLPHLSNISWNSQNGHQPHPRVEPLGVQTQHGGVPYPRPPLSHQNATLLPVPRTYNVPPPLNYQTRGHCPYQIISHQPILMLPRQTINTPVLPNQISNSEAGNPGLG